MTQVFIAWVGKGEKHFSFLAYDNGNGQIRVYEKDKYDGRLDLGRTEPLPYFDSYAAAIFWMANHKGEQCQVDTKLYKAFRFEKCELAEPVEGRREDNEP